MTDGIIWCPHCGKPHPLGTKICPTSAKTLERRVNTTKFEPKSPLVGVTIAGRYRVTKLIGTGGMGEVYEAENLVLRRLVAVKVVSSARANRDAMARLEREAQIISAVQHPNICDVYDIAALPDGSPVIVLERLFGETLAALSLRRPQLELRRAMDIFAQALSGLHAAHGAHIVHRDLKPQNIYLADRLGVAPLVKLVDFGFAKDVSGLRVRAITKPGALLGTLRYMAPEQLMGGPIDLRADIFAIGIILHEALAGAHPFGASSNADLQANILRAPPIPLSKHRPDLPFALTEILLRALAKHPAQRWSSAFELQRALASIHDESPRSAP